jgi:DNA-directed RNA polymerase specialized sigma24 family protein
LGWLCDRYRDQAVGYAYSVLRDRGLAEDAVQLAFARILARVNGGDQELLGDDPERVVVRNTRWASLELLERRRRHETSELNPDQHGATEVTGGVWERSQARMLCDQIAKSLPAHYLDVLRMRYVEGRHDADGAARLRLSVKAYRCRVDRALRAARLNANRLGIDGLGGFVVLGWRGLVRRASRLRSEILGQSSELAQVGSVGAHGLVVLLAIGGLAVAPLLVGGTSPAHSLRTQSGGAASELLSSATAGQSTPSASSATCGVACRALALPPAATTPPSAPAIGAPHLTSPSLSGNPFRVPIGTGLSKALVTPLPSAPLPLPIPTPLPGL